MKIPLFKITKPITVTLTVECASEKEAMNWAEKIVADIQDENGNALESKEIVSFEAETDVRQIDIQNL